MGGGPCNTCGGVRASNGRCYRCHPGVRKGHKFKKSATVGNGKPNLVGVFEGKPPDRRPTVQEFLEGSVVTADDPSPEDIEAAKAALKAAHDAEIDAKGAIRIDERDELRKQWAARAAEERKAAAVGSLRVNDPPPVAIPPPAPPAPMRPAIAEARIVSPPKAQEFTLRSGTKVSAAVSPSATLDGVSKVPVGAGLPLVIREPSQPADAIDREMDAIRTAIKALMIFEDEQLLRLALEMVSRRVLAKFPGLVG